MRVGYIVYAADSMRRRWTRPPGMRRGGGGGMAMISDQWISTDDRLPDPGDKRLYLVYVPDEDNYDLAVYVENKDAQFWHGWRYSYPLNVSHYQPLPRKPRANENHLA